MTQGDASSSRCSAARGCVALAERGQDNGRTYRLGFLLPSSRHGAVDAFFDESRLNGFVEGKSLVVMPAASRRPTTISPNVRRLWSMPRPTRSSRGLAAKALGYEVPAGLVLRADEVIE